MVEEKEWIYRIALRMLPGLGDVTSRKLIEHFGNAEAVFTAKKKDFAEMGGINGKIAGLISPHSVIPRAEEEWRFVQKHKIEPFFYTDAKYPVRLRQCPDNPLMLFFKGNCDLNARHIVSVVGTRQATSRGKQICNSIIDGLAAYGVVVMSGLAYGIDTCAHRAAVNKNLPTVAVLGHGLDRIYPQQNAKLAKQIIKNGGLLTEFFSGSLPDRENFPKRNRIIAGICDAVIVVEAAKKGGALITADIAASYSRDVFAVPGRWDDEFSVGCNGLIKQNKAALIQSAEDVLYIMGWDRKKEQTKGIQTRLFEQMGEKEQLIYSVLLEHGTAGIDWICHTSGLSGSIVASVLLNMEFDGMIRVLPGKLYALS